MKQIDPDRHFSDGELQELLDRCGTGGDKGLPAHFGGCSSCLGRLEEFESLYALLDSPGTLAAPPHLEEAVMNRLFPAAKRRAVFFPNPLPRWAPVAAVFLLSLSTAFSFGILKLFGIALGPILEVALQSRLQYFVTPLSLAAGALDKLSALGTWLEELRGDSLVTFSALLHLWDAPEVRLLILASAWIYLMIALGWGSHKLLSRTRGGIHNAMLT